MNLARRINKYSDAMKVAVLSLAVACLAPIHAHATRVPIGHGAMLSDLDTCRSPFWPANTRERQSGSTTTIEMQIGTDGRAVNARIKTSSGKLDLDHAALSSIYRCSFNQVVASGAAPTGWLQAQFVWEHRAPIVPIVRDAALLASTRKLAAAGDAAAQNKLGAWYQDGTYVDQDLVRALAWYQLAAQAGNAVAQNNLGVLYNRGLGVRRDTRLAVDWYAKAAAQGHAWAQANLAWAYQYGTAGETSMDKARYWLAQSARGGLADAQARLGFLDMGRAASEEERSAAAGLLERAAAQDHPTGLYYLGRSFELGKGRGQDDGKAVANYRRALGRTGGRAETALGMLIEAGRAPAQEHDEARKLYQAAIAQRYADAHLRYGQLLEQRGDRALAAGVFRKGANMGSCEAAIRYVALRGPLGLPPERVGHDVFLGQASWCATRQAPAAPL